MMHQHKWHWVATLAVLLVGVAGVRRLDLPLGPAPIRWAAAILRRISRLPTGESAQNYWEGNPNGNMPRYITDLLADPANTLTVNLAVPNDRDLFEPYVGQVFPHVILVCYPTNRHEFARELPVADG
jgi:hypothetical protein